MFVNVKPAMHQDPEFATSFLGARFRVDFAPSMVSHKANLLRREGVDRFEWDAVLDSVASCGANYTMVELGAGFGWWGINAATALRRDYPGKPGRIILVEAEPQHYQFLQMAVADNPLPGIQYDTLQVAVGPADGCDLFYTGRSADWYGQRLILDYHREHLASGAEEHFQRDEVTIKTSDGYELSEVGVMPLRRILEPSEDVDLIDMDIQGSELDVVGSSLETLRSKCRRLYIATHSREIHEALLGLLEPDWDIVAAFPPEATVHTAIGPVKLQDGVQYWKRA